MTVAELIKRLQAHPNQDAVVLVYDSQEELYRLGGWVDAMVDRSDPPIIRYDRDASLVAAIIFDCRE